MIGVALADLDTAGSVYFLGVDSTTGIYDDSKLAFAPQRANRQLVARVGLLRNVDSLRETVTDANGNVMYDITDLGSKLAADGKNPGRVGLLLEDYALNESLQFVDIGPQSMTLTGTDVAGGESKQIEIFIKPDRLADTKLVWATDDESIATVDDKGVVTGVSDGVATITAAVSYNGKTFRVTSIGQDAFYTNMKITSVTIPEGVTVTLQGEVRIDGKLCIEGKLYVPHDATLVIGDDALIVNPENIVYEGCHHENTTETVKAATCTEDGQSVRTCARCGAVETRTDAATGHVDADNDGKCDTCSACLVLRRRKVN